MACFSLTFQLRNTTLFRKSRLVEPLSHQRFKYIWQIYFQLPLRLLHPADQERHRPGHHRLIP